MLKFANKYIISSQKLKIITIGVLLSGSSVLNILTSMLLMRIIDDILPSNDMTTLIKAVLTFISIVIVQMILSFFCSLYNSYFILDTTRNMKKEMISKIFERDGSFFNNIQKGELTQAIESDILSFCRFIMENIFSILRTIITLVSTIVFLAVLDYRLLILMLLIQPLSLVLQILINPLIRKLSIKRRNLYAEYSSYEQEVVSDPIELIISGFRKYLIRGFFKKLDGIIKTDKKMSAVHSFSVNIFEFISAVTTCAIIGYGGHHIIIGSMSIGILITFIEQSSRITSSINNIMDFTIDYSEIEPIYEKLASYLEIIPPDKKEIVISERPNICLKDVNFSYNGMKKIYHNVNCHFEYGKFYGLVGKSGEGKSTLVKLIFGLWQPDTGEVFINGEPCSNFSSDSISKIVSYVSPSPILLNESIRYNLTLGQKGFSDEQLYKALKKSELFDEVCLMNGKLDFVIGDNGSQLSLGQRQRLSLARTFLLGKKVIILDEPTSALDPYTANKVMNNLYLELKNKLVIIISHNYSVLNRCDKVYLLKNGTFTELSNDSFNRL